MIRCPLLLVSLALLSAPLAAQSSVRPPAAINAIREADLKRDLYALASDSMRGREAGTIDEMRASVWVADQMAKIGLRPLGDFGSWFQWWSIRRTRISSTSSSVKLNGHPLPLWIEVTPTTNTAADVAGPTFFVNDWRDTTIAVRGKIVASDFLVEIGDHLADLP